MTVCLNSAERMSRRAVVWLVVAAATGWLGLAQAGVFETPIQLADIDNAATADWFGGILRIKPAFSASPAVNQPSNVLFTQTTKPGAGWTYGPSTEAGPRHVRIGFKRAMAIGTVMTLGDSVLSVLAPGAVYPGNLTNEQDWIPAERLSTTTVTAAAPLLSEVALWVLPPQTTSRALRFSHESKPSDPSYVGTISGVCVLSDRLANSSPQAVAIAPSNSESTGLVNDSLISTSWDNGGQSEVVSAQNPQDLLLVWPSAISLQGLCALRAGFSEAQVDRYVGPAERHPREASESDWAAVGVYTNLEYQAQRRLSANWLDFGGTITTRAIRLRIQKGSDPIIDPASNSLGGKKVGLGELAALMPLANLSLATAVLPASPNSHPPIPVPFYLDAPGLVTLVIEDAAGRRVRNLVSETAYPAGQNTAWWDGLDESGKVNVKSTTGRYDVQGNLVEPGTYHSRGLVRDALELRYEFTVGAQGNPPWRVSGSTAGGWLADHRPPSDVLSLPGAKPQMLIASEVAEAGDGLVWTDLEGRKQKGRTALAPGGFYTASHLALDGGSSVVTGIAAYAGYANGNTIYFYGVSSSGNPVTLPQITQPDESQERLTGLAARNGLLFASLGPLSAIRVLDVRTQTFSTSTDVPDPRGLAFDLEGRLLVLSRDRLLRYLVAPNTGALSSPSVVISAGLDDPRKLTLDAVGNIYISQWGNSHQVAVFDAEGHRKRTIGNPGAPSAGPYDPNHMNHPNGLAIAADGRLWVAEYDQAPKRVSVWNQEGHLEKAFYGPPKYGGGGQLDPLDKTRFYYGDYDDDDPVPYFIGMEYQLDWSSGSSYLSHIYYRTGTNGFYLPYSGPETPIYVEGRQYMVNTFNANPASGAPVAGIWQMRQSIAVPVAAAGRSSLWPWLVRPEFAARLPKGATLSDTVFVWSDLNDDAVAEPEEVSFRQAPNTTFYVGAGLSLLSGHSLSLSPQGFTARGAPVYDLDHASVLISGLEPSRTTGGGQFFATATGGYVLTGGPMLGYRDGQVEWSYPSPWPSLHASHSAPVPSHPGEMIGTTRLLGPPLIPDRGEAGEIWAVNGNYGNIYLLTADGLFLATLFQDVRTAPAWSMPVARRGMLLNDVSLYDECFGPTIVKTTDGNVYLAAGKAHSSLMRIDGLEGVRRLPANTFPISAPQLASASAWLSQQEAARRASVGRETLEIASAAAPPVIDGLLTEWTNQWIRVDDRVQASLAVGQGLLYAAFRTGDKSLLASTGESTELLFKNGGALDLMIGTTIPAADERRMRAFEGDLRLLVTRVNGRTKAVLYRPVVEGTPRPVVFSSPLRTIALDRVDDVSAAVSLQSGKSGEYELAVPLATLGLNPLPTQFILGDLGVLRGNGERTVQRVYWQNKATGLISDIPSEAELTPSAWGRWHFPEWLPEAPVVDQTVKLSLARDADGDLQVTAASASDQVLVIERSSDLQTWTPVHTNSTLTGLACWSDRDCGAFVRQFYRVCIGGSSTGSDVVGTYQVPLQAGANFISIPFQPSADFRGELESATVDTITFVGTPEWAVNEFAFRENRPQYILRVTKAASAGSQIEGDWWYIRSNTATTVTLDPSADDLQQHLSVGDTLAVQRLTSIKDLFGSKSTCTLNPDQNLDVLTLEEDVVRTLEGTSFADEIFYHDGSLASAGYYLNGVLAGDGDGSTITFNPDQPLMLFRKSGAPAASLTLCGHVQRTALTHYLTPGANPMATVFPVEAPLSTGGLKESGWTSDTNFDVLRSEEDIIRSVVGTSLADEVFHYSGGDAPQGWYANGTRKNDYALQPARGYIFFIQGPETRIWRQPSPLPR